MHQQITLFTKPVIYVVTSFILAALIYSSAPTFVVFVQGEPSFIDTVLKPELEGVKVKE